jgi:hypothetical protein
MYVNTKTARRLALRFFCLCGEPTADRTSAGADAVKKAPSVGEIKRLIRALW